jgi:hypothetical protein
LSPRQERLALIALSLAYGALAAYACTLTSFWSDEEFTALAMGEPGFRAMFHLLKGDVHPPLFYVAERAWLTLFGWAGPDLALRLFSVACGVASLWAWHALFRRLAPRSGAGLGAVFLVACTPFTSWFWTEARMYSLYLLLTPLAWMAWMRLAEAPGSWRARWAAAFWTVLLALTHTTALVGSCAFGLWMLLEARGKADRAGRWKAAAWAALLCAALYVPNWDTLRYQMDRHQEYWIQAPTWKLGSLLVEQLRIYFVHAEGPQGWLAGALVAASALALAWSLAWAPRGVRQLLGASFVGFFCLYWALSLWGKPFLIPRVTLPWVPVLFFGACTAWEAWGGRLGLGAMLLAAFAVAAPSQVALHLGAGREDSRGAVGFAKRFARPGDCIWRASNLGGTYIARAGMLPPEGREPGRGRYWLLRRQAEPMQGRPAWQAPERFPGLYQVIAERDFPSSYHPYWGLQLFLVQERRSRA